MSGMKPVNPRRIARGGSFRNEDSCNIRFRIDLMGVRAQVAAALRPGHTLDVVIGKDGELRAVVCQTDRGERVGSVSAFPGLAKLIECLEAGVRYSAVVEKASERSCAVFVTQVPL